MTPKRLYEVATRARRLLSRDGWQRGSFGSRGNPHCLIGALGIAAGAHPGADAPERLALAAILEVEPFEIAHWNDHRATGVDAVAAALDALASMALSEMHAPEEAP